MAVKIITIDGVRYELIPLRNNTPDPVFTTPDGTVIYRGDDIWVLSTISWIKHKMPVQTTLRQPPFEGLDNNFLYFSSKESVEEYILMNKPCLSARDVIEFHNSNLNKFSPKPLNVLIKELAKQKINP